VADTEYLALEMFLATSRLDPEALLHVTAQILDARSPSGALNAVTESLGDFEKTLKPIASPAARVAAAIVATRCQTFSMPFFEDHVEGLVQPADHHVSRREGRIVIQALLVGLDHVQVIGRAGSC
jgi:hypothetical protein